MEITVATERDVAEWNRIVEDSSYGTIFHTWGWLKIIEKHTGSIFYPLIVYQDGHPAGILPLFYLKKMQIRMVFSPPPQTALFYLGPILIEHEKRKQHKKESIFKEFQKSVDTFLTNDLRAKYISISLPPGLFDPRPYSWAGYSVEPAYDYTQKITAGIETNWRMIPMKVRQNINRAKNRGISVLEGDRKDFERVVELMNIRYQERRRLVTVSKEYLLDLFDNYPDNIKVFVAKYEDEVISGVISVIYKNCLFSWIGNPKTSIPILPSPNDMLIWEEIEFGCNHGLTQYITLSAAGNERLHTYYSSKMNPELQIRFTVKKHSLTAGIMEKLYSGMVKPINERIH